jgi:recombination protein RecA
MSKKKHTITGIIPTGATSVLTPAQKAMMDRLEKIRAKIHKDVDGVRVMMLTDAPIKARTLPTGSIGLDYALGGGYAQGRIIEIYGPEGAGKCQGRDAIVATANGLLTIEELFEECGYKATCTSKVVPASYPLINRYGDIENLGALTWNGLRGLAKLTLHDGTVIKSTLNHPHLVLSEGFLVWRQTEKLAVGDVMVQPQTVAGFGQTKCNLEDAYLIGCLIADGHFAENHISITNNDPHVMMVIRARGEALLGKASLEYPRGSSVDFHFNSKEKVAAFYAQWGFKPGVAKDKNFTKGLRGFDRESQIALIRGYMDCEASHTPGKPGSLEVTSASNLLLRQLKLMLQAFGITSCVRSKKVRAYPDTPYWRLHITGSNVSRYDRIIGSHRFLIDGQPEIDQNTIPGIGRLVRALFDAHETDRAVSRLAGDLMSGQSESAEAVRKLLAGFDWQDHPAKAAIEALLGYVFVPIESIETVPAEPTFDVVMPQTHSFIAEGCVTHNTTMMLEAIALAQHAGGVGLFVDCEHAIDMQYAESLGVDPQKLLMVQPDTGEEALQVIEAALENMGWGDIVVCDSVAAMTPQAELKGEIGDQHVGLQSRMMSQGLRMINAKVARSGVCLMFTNQLRDNIGAAMFAPKKTTPGGNALKFYASQRLDIHRIGSIKKAGGDGLLSSSEDADIIGNRVEIKITKNKIAPPHRLVELSIVFGEGLRIHDEILTYGEKLEIITKTGATFSFRGEKLAVGRDASIAALKANPDMTEDLEAEIRVRLWPDPEAPAAPAQSG